MHHEQIRTMDKNKEREITRLVCFCAFNDSPVVEHLQKEESYLLTLCTDPGNLGQVVDAIHPDIILIDCTSKSPIGVESKEEVIELQDLAGSEEMMLHQGVSDSATCTTFLMPDYLSGHLPLSDIAHKGQVIFLFNADPGMAVKIRCFENGCDVMVAPFHLAELDFRIRLHAEKRELNYRSSWQMATLNRAVEHIDKLKQIIFGTRDELSREKELLYNSLKQINMMSSDRDLLKKKLHRSKVELYENIRGINDFLCTMVESRNEYQKGHSKRVAEISEFVADKIGMKAQAVRILKNAAMLHEVGMLLIPTSILNKEPSQLSDYEKNMMMMHPSNGAEYLKRCPGFEKVAGIIRHLHENSDGTGSPEGLKKRYIPLPSKVLAGADLLDQIWIDNPHASVERLLEILEGYAGSRLDPSIVNFLEKYVVTVLTHQVDQNHVRLKEIPFFQLEPGMVIGSAIFTKTGTKLFASGTTVTEESIQLLERYTREYPVDETVFIKVDL